MNKKTSLKKSSCQHYQPDFPNGEHGKLECSYFYFDNPAKAHKVKCRGNIKRCEAVKLLFGLESKYIEEISQLSIKLDDIRKIVGKY